MSRRSKQADTEAVNDVDETRDMIVLTLFVPREQLAVSVRDHTVTVEATGGFRKEIPLAGEADVEHLHAQLYDGTLELRAPRVETGPGRSVPVLVLR
jgi:HSP20 family molecular chaperone IbpA